MREMKNHRDPVVLADAGEEYGSPGFVEPSDMFDAVFEQKHSLPSPE